ncbi:unnamed protein product [Durusdinium trenchii]|uniref:Selenoprotein O n=1 Tax=Durusdinium trenchii TaxID=1381693 RepID=A0ABP0MKG9_9DINO
MPSLRCHCSANFVLELLRCGQACKEFDAAYREVARKVQQRSLLRQRHPSMSQVIIARMDQSANEHTELIKGTPWLRFWQRLPHPLSADKKKRGVDVELRSVDTILDFLDEQEPVAGALPFRRALRAPKCAWTNEKRTTTTQTPQWLEAFKMGA